MRIRHPHTVWQYTRWVHHWIDWKQLNGEYHNRIVQICRYRDWKASGFSVLGRVLQNIVFMCKRRNISSCSEQSVVFSSALIAHFVLSFVGLVLISNQTRCTFTLVLNEYILFSASSFNFHVVVLAVFTLLPWAYITCFPSGVYGLCRTH